MIADVEHQRFTVDQYHRMAEAGVLTEDDRTELIDGELIVMCPMGSRHAAICDRLARLLHRRTDDRVLVRDQTPIILGPRDEPVPDLAIVRHRSDDYRSALPTVADVLLLIEVTDTTYRDDHDVKLPLYATAGIPEVWLVDAGRKRIEVHRLPMGSVYTETRILVPGQRALVPESGAWIEEMDLAGAWG